MKTEDRTGQNLLMVFILFGILFHFPILSVFNKPVGLMQWPLLFVYIMLAWLALIGALYVMTEGNPFKHRKP